MLLQILGVPQPKQSARIGRDRAGNVRAFKSAKVRKNEQNIVAQIAKQLPEGFMPWSGPIRVNSITYVFPPLKSFTKKKMKMIEDGDIVFKTTKPDLTDNLQKGLFDALEGVLFLNDSQVCEILSLRKIYGLVPGIYIDIEEIK